jgi:hypothetical protein
MPLTESSTAVNNIDDHMNTARFLANQKTYFLRSYDGFRAFGGPCVYFHLECLRAGRESFLSQRHIEMLYATLTAWGMHRMGDAETTKTKLTDWEHFQASLLAVAPALTEFRGCKLLEMSESQYSEAVSRLLACYQDLDLSVSGATIVSNSKALYHLLPDFIPPIDRQYTIRFFTRGPETWRDAKGKFRMISLPSGIESQFSLFHKTCVDIKRLADRIDPALFEAELRQHEVTAPKALDNAIVNYVRIVSVAYLSEDE